MATKSYTNPINEMEVSIAIERLAIAAYPNTSFISSLARVSIDSLPTGWADLGAVVEDSPSFKVERTMFELQTGIPVITQYQAVTGLSGTFDAALHSASWRKVQYALGNYSAVTSQTQVASISSVVARTQIVVSAASLAQIAIANRQITIANSGSQDAADAIETWISSLSTVASGVALLYLGATPVRTPVAGQATYIYSVAQQILGSGKLASYALLGISDLIDGTQVVHYFSKVQPMGNFTEEFRPGQNQRTPLHFKAFGYTKTAPDGTDQLILAERFYFPLGT